MTSDPLELVCMDTLEIGTSRSKNRYVLVIIDHFSKYAVAEAIPNKSEDTIAQVFVEKFVLLVGAPKKIHSDQGTEFVNHVLSAVALKLKISQSTTCGYDPQCNGLVERLNQTILRMLKRTTPSTWDWDLRLPYVMFAYNVTPSSFHRILTVYIDVWPESEISYGRDS